MQRNLDLNPHKTTLKKRTATYAPISFQNDPTSCVNTTARNDHKRKIFK